MTKLTILAATFMALLLLFEASRITATVEDEEMRNPGMRTCRKQVQQLKNLRNCQEYMKEQIHDGKQLNHKNDEYYHYPEECCDELRQMDSKCRCEGLKQAINQLMKKGKLQGEDLSDAYWIARDLPMRCGLRPGHCRMQ
ncbi:hypothetical protein P3X46_006688 [Hevea brasiliensis]|uniref:Bifunctional inhibitor/plant lipid transfer protein/seed storage helical domain-containing protein n=2 Tax=Hevea brasiliensis TaxID=3981 RepID=A0ABQ9MTJ4_HEVBR|nr:hypothetical protein P3X46_006688 [Hevea brasiliensis]